MIELKNQLQFALVAFILVFSMSCNRSMLPFESGFAEELNGQTLSSAKANEVLKGSEDITPSYLVTIGEQIYPNQNQYELGQVSSWTNTVRAFDIKTNYYYSVPDSLLRVVMYEWNIVEEVLRNGSEVEQQKMRIELYKSLQLEMNRILGAPAEVESFEKPWEFKEYGGHRVSAKWRSVDFFSAHLFMLADDENNYYRLRLAIYKN